jgi:hypothetical protein
MYAIPMVLIDVRLMDHPRPALYAVENSQMVYIPLPHDQKQIENNGLFGSSMA